MRSEHDSERECSILATLATVSIVNTVICILRGMQKYREAKV